MRDDLYNDDHALDADAGKTPLDKFCKHVANATNNIGQHHNKLPEVFGPYSVKDLPKVNAPDTLRTAIEQSVHRATTEVKPEIPKKGATFATEHNEGKHVYPGLGGYPPKKPLQVVPEPQDPAEYYNGTQTLDNMITAYGKEFVRQWAIGNTHKYLERMGLKNTATIADDKKKALWYLAVAERLYKEITGGN
jgi:hypothetical protein